MDKYVMLSLGALIVLLSGAEYLLLTFGLVDGRALQLTTAVPAWYTATLPFLGLLIGFVLIRYSDRFRKP